MKSEELLPSSSISSLPFKTMKITMFYLKHDREHNCSVTSILPYCTVMVLMIFFMSTTAYSSNRLRAPQSLNPYSQKMVQSDPQQTTIYNKLVTLPVVFYQEFMSPYWGYSCSHRPSCSSYSILAIKKHGPFIGLVMTFDRLQREANEAKYSPLIKESNQTYVLDPVENNDFWWYHQRSCVPLNSCPPDQ